MDQKSKMKARLKQLIAEQGTSARAVSITAGLAHNYISDILDGKNENPSLRNMKEVAQVLGVSVAYLMGESDDRGTPEDIPEAAWPRGFGPQRLGPPIPVIGAVETGTQREFAPVITGGRVLYAPRSVRYPRAMHYAMKIDDSSMVGRNLHPGMHILCVDMVEAGVRVESDKLYVIRRTDNNGAKWETIVRRAEVRVGKDGTEIVELHPHSPIKRYRSETLLDDLVITPALKVPQDQSICVAGLVYGIYESLE